MCIPYRIYEAVLPFTASKTNKGVLRTFSYLDHHEAIKTDWFVCSRTNNFSAIWRQSPLPLTAANLDHA
jgi:hypothetical protein